MDKITEQELMDMELHEDRGLGAGIFISRVIGGWIYWRREGTRDTSLGFAGVFVPESPKSNAGTI